MMFKTHVAFGILLALVASPYLSPENRILFLLIAGIAAGLPDLDSPDSKLGRNVKIIGWIFDHRGIFHSLVGAAVFSLLFYAVFRDTTYAAAFAIGYCSHLLADSLNREGVMPLYPLTRFRLKSFMKTGGILETLLFLAIVAADVWLFIY